MLKCWGSEPRSSSLFNVDALGQLSFSKLKNPSSSQIFSYASGSKLYPRQSLGGSDGGPKFWTSVAWRLVSVFYQIFASYFSFILQIRTLKLNHSLENLSLDEYLLLKYQIGAWYYDVNVFLKPPGSFLSIKNMSKLKWGRKELCSSDGNTILYQFKMTTKVLTKHLCFLAICHKQNK